MSKSDKIFSLERSDVYLANESCELESVNRVYEIGEKAHSLLDHPRISFIIIKYATSKPLIGIHCLQL